MKNTNGQFKKGHKWSKEIQEKLNFSIKESWKKRTEYHGFYHTKFHNSWRSMKARCNGTSGNQSNRKYHDKGIRYCEKWETFFGFKEDMFDSYIEGYSIDRIDNSKGYTKENCRWATAKQQANNISTNVKLLFNGEIKTLSEWSDFLGIKYVNMRNRYYRMYKKDKITLENLLSKV